MASNSSPSNSVLSPFPSEVLDIILDNLPRKAILSCLRVNSFFYGTIRPRKCFRLQLRPAPDGRLICVGVYDKPGEHGGDSRLPSFTRRWIPNLVQCLEVFPHLTSACDHFVGHSRIKDVGLKPSWGTVTPSIVHLNFAPAPATPKRGLHVDESDSHRYRDRWVNCGALEAVSPHTLVCNFWDLSEEEPPCNLCQVTRAVFIARRTFKASGFIAAVSFDTVHLPALEDITIVLACGAEEDWTPTPHGSDSGGKWRKWLKRIARSFLLRLFSIRRPEGTVRLTLVNTSANGKQAVFEDKSRDDTLRTTQDSIHRFMVDCSKLFPHPYTRYYREDFEDMYRVVSLEEFVASSPSVLAPEDVGEWL